MTYLTIDRGNTTAKVTVWKGRELIETHRFPHLNVEDLVPVFEKWMPVAAAVSTVGRIDIRFLESLRKMVEGRLLVLTSGVSLPIKLNYGSLGSLGVDRIAAAVGAWDLTGKPSLVVDAGTAMTLDLINDEGNFMGGNISPGMGLRFKSLHEATQQLPVVEAQGDLPAIGEDTVSAIRCGVVRGMAAEIEDVFQIGKQLYGCEEIIMTGNDCEALAPLLEEKGHRVRRYPDLVGLGLIKILEYNNI